MGKSSKYIFRSKNGCCPQCIAFGKIYFIQDRHIGGEKYEYALMSKPIKTKTWIFSDTKNMISFLAGEEITDDIATNLYMSQMTVYQCSSRRILETNGVKYIWDSYQKELRKLVEPEQETGYCSTYWECLNLSKEILKNLEQKDAGIQLSFLY